MMEEIKLFTKKKKTSQLNLVHNMQKYHGSELNTTVALLSQQL